MRVLTSFDLQSNLGLTRGILVILVKKKALWVLWCPNGLCHVILDVLAASWRDGIFGFFEVWHANRGWTKYGINRFVVGMGRGVGLLIVDC